MQISDPILRNGAETDPKTGARAGVKNRIKACRGAFVRELPEQEALDRRADRAAATAAAAKNAPATGPRKSPRNDASSSPRIGPENVPKNRPAETAGGERHDEPVGDRGGSGVGVGS